MENSNAVDSFSCRKLVSKVKLLKLRADFFSFSTSQTFRSWDVIFYRRRPIVFLSFSLYDTPELAFRMRALFQEQGFVPVSFSKGIPLGTIEIVYISKLVRFARCCTSVLDFHSKNHQITSKLLTQGYRYHKLRKTFGKFFRSYSELLSKFGDISFQEYVFKGISHPVFYGDLVYKLRRVKDTPNFISSGSKIVKRLRRRQYDPLIIETTIGLVLGPCTALCRLFLKHCTLTNKAVGTIWRALSKPPQRRQGPDLRPLWLLVGTPSAIRPELAFSRAEHRLPFSDVTIYIFAILYLSSMPYV